ncbi:UDP-N-acetylmuramate dehydrogenase [Jonesia denitrificans]|uniref:UDP-N-acetylenolpyruvoylglucosamine reductase n=1 Tax=Jonesia denitrificans (strain ATCC 14870 / DSM 20603 / BCRC 15368 / CIP 55.134 / JCM 11481 / NBRC 15587 / NCTC 10816 / Prevot 55134) TaxID=471856 RepID=C7R0S4_JONDD|nr:UDP-N-acetylmuramate dehydrogenase [Jonesia denitrificans]ACV08231.1 UDP-N-acetylmuramate dehydrogenase [Jonesia denitrificans DSM 20603]SQH20212.1 UDP-N-acetylenolpyruvoylglucosamine reductase [Jonesia denitrificans]
MTDLTVTRPAVLDRASTTRTFADLTTLRVGGPIDTYVDTTTEQEFIDVISYADAVGLPLLVIGGGSNIVAQDAPFPGIVVRDIRTGVAIESQDSCGGATVTVPAGHVWDDLVDDALAAGWVGIECLAGIPGTVGAAPVQNIGAYGQEVAHVISSVRVWDRKERRARLFAVGELAFAYRDSLLKRTMTDRTTGPLWGPSPRYIVLAVSFQFRLGTRSAPIAYQELATHLGVDLGDRANTTTVADAVRALRARKDMLEDPTGRPPHTQRSASTNSTDTTAHHDPSYNRWSAGSFFTNPIIAASDAANLPHGAPTYPVRTTQSETTAGPSLGAIDPDHVKTSAAWLIDHAGLHRGYGLTGHHSPATLSTVHTLALTNRGTATATDIRALADHVIAKVHATFGITLQPEPVHITTIPVVDITQD